MVICDIIRVVEVVKIGDCVMKRLSHLKPGDVCFIRDIGKKGAFRRHLIDMGMTPGTKLEMIRFAPLGDPIQIRMRGYTLSIRKSEAEKIIVSSNSQKVFEKDNFQNKVKKIGSVDFKCMTY